MKIELKRFNECLATFLKSVLAPAAKSRSTKFRIGWALGSGRAAVAEGGDHYMALKASGVVCEDGSIDVDQLKRCVYGGLDLSGTLRIDELGIDIERPEVDRFVKLLETETPQ